MGTLHHQVAPGAQEPHRQPDRRKRMLAAAVPFLLPYPSDPPGTQAARSELHKGERTLESVHFYDAPMSLHFLNQHLIHLAHTLQGRSCTRVSRNCIQLISVWLPCAYTFKSTSNPPGTHAARSELHKGEQTLDSIHLYYASISLCFETSIQLTWFTTARSELYNGEQTLDSFLQCFHEPTLLNQHLIHIAYMKQGQSCRVNGHQIQFVLIALP